MRVFRRRSSLGFLALLAFAMQAVLALAQTHAHAHASAAAAGPLAMRAITFGACAPRAEHPCAPSVPRDDGGNCPICWSVNLATAAILHQPPVVPTPPARFAAPEPVNAVHALTGGESVHFQARAPPLLLMG
jgi:hypothetical protein